MICPIGRTSTGERQLIVPYTLDANDMRFATPQGFNSGDQFFTYLKDSFDVLYAEGQRGAAEDAVGRAALPAGRAARAVPRPWPGSSTMCRATSRSGSAAGSTSRGIGTSSTERTP